MKVRPLDASGYPIDYSMIRFKKVVTVASIPKPGETLQLRDSEPQLPATVVRVDWNEDVQMFVVACQFGNRSITAAQHAALVEDPEWRSTSLI